MDKPQVHFVGVTTDQYWSAVRIWGKPDHVHGRATWSCMGAIPGRDTVILGRIAFPMPDKWRRKTGGYAHAVPPS